MVVHECRYQLKGLSGSRGHSRHASPLVGITLLHYYGSGRGSGIKS